MKLHHLIRVIKIVLLKILIINFVNMKNTLSIPRFLLLIVLFLSITLVRTVSFAFHLSVCVKTLCDPMDSSPPGSSFQGILQARIQEWVAMPPPEDLPDSGMEPTSFYIFCIGRQFLYHYAMLSHFSRVRLCATLKTAAHQAPPSLGFSRQEHWSGLPFPSPMHESEK